MTTSKTYIERTVRQIPNYLSPAKKVIQSNFKHTPRKGMIQNAQWLHEQRRWFTPGSVWMYSNRGVNLRMDNDEKFIIDTPEKLEAIVANFPPNVWFYFSFTLGCGLPSNYVSMFNSQSISAGESACFQ